MAPRMPKLIVFDLDYTLWPLWIDTHISPPLRQSSPSSLVDRSGTELAFYSDVPGILAELREHKVMVGIASRTSAPDLARKALSMLKVKSRAGEAEVANTYFDATAIEIYPGSKIRHFQQIHKKTGVAYEEMVFFDDESRNREVATQLGVTFVLVPDGVTRSVFARGLNDWRKGRGITVEKP